MCALLMLRRFLACLALLTGLAAAGAPAQAEIAMALASQMEASATGQTASRHASVEVALPLSATPTSGIETRVEPLSGATAPAPTVRIRCDRARE